MPDINHFLLLVVCASCLLLVVRFAGFSGKKKMNRWVWTALVILAVVGTTYLLEPNVAGYVGGVFWIIFILLPALTSRYLQFLLNKQRYPQALGVSRLLGILQPFDDWKGMPEIIEAFALIQAGAVAEAEEVVKRRRDHERLMDRVLYSFYLTSTGRFTEYIRWIEETFANKALEKYPELIPRYLQALGETGRIREMIDIFSLCKDSLSSPPLRRHLMLGRLYLFAFYGRHRDVEHLLQGPLKSLTPDSKSIWLATARQAAGDSEQALAILNEIKPSSPQPIRLLREKRLRSPLKPAVEGEKSELLKILDAEGRLVVQWLRFAYPITLTRHKRNAYATYGILAVMTTVFLLEVGSGGSTNTLNLIRLGAMVKTPFTQFEWWRPITSLFLHFGFYHFLLNGLAFFIIAPYVESWLGRWRFLLIFFASGIIANFVDVALYTRPFVVLVGASGAVMGVLGATSHRLFLGVSVEKSPAARRSLTLILYILAFQVILDLSTPRVSLRAHLLGLSIGFLLSVLLKRRINPKRE